jgi:hypothetical protein
VYWSKALAPVAIAMRYLERLEVEMLPTDVYAVAKGQVVLEYDLRRKDQEYVGVAEEVGELPEGWKQQTSL